MERCDLSLSAPILMHAGSVRSQGHDRLGQPVLAADSRQRKRRSPRRFAPYQRIQSATRRQATALRVLACRRTCRNLHNCQNPEEARPTLPRSPGLEAKSDNFVDVWTISG